LGFTPGLFSLSAIPFRSTTVSNQPKERDTVRKLICVKAFVASMMLASAAAARAQEAQLLYGTSTPLPVTNPFSISTTVPTLRDPRSQYVVVAESNANTNLEVLAWQDTTSSLLLTSTPGIVVSPGVIGVGVTGLDSGRVVTADVNNTGVLSVNTWTVGTAGVALQNGYSTAASTANHEVAIATLSPTEVVTAYAAPNGTLAVEAWTISAGGLPTPVGAIGYQNENLAGSQNFTPPDGFFAAQVSIATVSPNQVVTAIADNNQSMWVTTWEIDSFGATSQELLQLPNTVKNAPGTVAVGAGRVFQPNGGGFFPSFGYAQSAFTPFINPQGNVDVFYWDITPSGLLTQLTTPSSSLSEDFYLVAASMLPRNIPITSYYRLTFGCVFVGDYAGFPSIPAPAQYCPTLTDEITSIGSAAAGTDANFLSLFEPYNAYFVSAALALNPDNSGSIFINVFSYPEAPLL
jgi:hypothetical protein